MPDTIEFFSKSDQYHLTIQMECVGDSLRPTGLRETIRDKDITFEGDDVSRCVEINLSYVSFVMTENMHNTCVVR